MSGPLRKICVTTVPPAEDAVSELLQQFFQLPATGYTDVSTGLTEVAVYLAAPGAWSPQTRTRLAKRIQHLKRCGLEIGPAKITTARLRPSHWSHSWKRHFRPISIASRLLIKPSWSRRRPRRGQRVVILDPGLSFGTGQHTTTLFFLQQLSGWRLPGRPQSLLDLGTGSGILAIAAARLGYEPVDALDFDPAAVRVAQANARRNHTDAIQFRCQDVRKLALHSQPLYSAVCANLMANLLVAERRRIRAALASDGILILAGILRQEFAGVKRAYEGEGLRMKRERREGEWHSASFTWR